MSTSIYEMIENNFLEPFVDELMQQFSRGEDIIKLIFLLKCTKYSVLNCDIIKFILCEEQISENLVLILQNIWKVVNNKVGLDKIYADKQIHLVKIQIFCIQYFVKRIMEHYKINKIKIKNYFDNCAMDMKEALNSITNLYIKYGGHNFIKGILSSLSYMLYEIDNQSLNFNEEFLKILFFDTDKNDTTNKANFGQNITKFYKLDFSNKNLDNLLPINKITFKDCSFKNAEFNGDGMQTCCIHWHVIDCDFTDCKFNGKRCCKMSTWENCNFTNVDLTGVITYNFGYSKIINCNMSDAYVYYPENKKLMGKHLMRFLKDKYDDSINNYYNSPNDGGYDKNELDPEIWITLE